MQKLCFGVKYVRQTSFETGGLKKRNSTLCNVLQQCLEEKKHYVSRLHFIKDPIMILFSHLTFSSSHNIRHNRPV